MRNSMLYLSDHEMASGWFLLQTRLLGCIPQVYSVLRVVEAGGNKLVCCHGLSKPPRIGDGFMLHGYRIIYPSHGYNGCDGRIAATFHQQAKITIYETLPGWILPPTAPASQVA